MEHCYNRGCGQLFDPENNHEESCRHHPGAPFFHDAYKGWSCCKKKSVDFTEFLNIKGCTLSKHSNVKPPEAEKPEKNDDTDNDVPIEKEIRAPIVQALARPPVETPMVVINAKVATALKQSIDAAKRKMDKPSSVVEERLVVGTSCKNSGCTYAYSGTVADGGECQYHPGVPIFHEGMKYWSCCQKKTSDFAVFMVQPGCALGQHKWFKEQQDKKVVRCRYDWLQTASDIVVSIYAKLYSYEESKIEVNPIRLHVNLVFPEQDNAKFDLDLELRGIVDVARTTAQMYASKVEITMPKAEPGHWQKFDFPREKLPAPLSTNDSSHLIQQRQTSRESEDDDDFNLDDVETTGVRLTEIASHRINSKNNNETI